MGICQALDFVDAIRRYLDRLDVRNATLVATLYADVNRPAVGEIEDRVGNRQAADLPAALPVHHDLAAARVDVHDCHMVRSQQHPAASFSPGETVVRRSEEHTSELQSLMRISYADFCLKKNTKTDQKL